MVFGFEADYSSVVRAGFRGLFYSSYMFRHSGGILKLFTYSVPYSRCSRGWLKVLERRRGTLGALGFGAFEVLGFRAGGS